MEKPIVIELYELWNSFKTRFNIVSPQPKSFELIKTIQPVTTLDHPEILVFDYTDDTSIAAAGNSIILLTPPAGFIYRLMEMNAFFPDPVGSGAGTHSINVYSMNGSNSEFKKLFVTGDFGTTLIVGRYGTGTGTTVLPSNAGDFRTMTSRIFALPDHPIKFDYKNDTDVAAAVERRFLIMVEKRPQGEL